MSDIVSMSNEDVDLSELGLTDEEIFKIKCINNEYPNLVLDDALGFIDGVEPLGMSVDSLVEEFIRESDKFSSMEKFINRDVVKEQYFAGHQEVDGQAYMIR